ncbi:MAG: MBOAT family protein, partial [Prevotellaceae bacterium]|nr:MBOAT family protein [Prevotellaceae bacterium]
IGKLLGFKFLNNFKFPYFSRDIAEFWRRWHISLNTWFRDYLYIPLGGSRVSKAKVVRNTFAIFLVSGFWHGANWTFIAWGAFHAFLFLPEILAGKNRKYTNTVAENRILPTFKEFFQMLLTFSLVVVGWVFFRAETIGDAVEYLGGIMDMSLFSTSILIRKKLALQLVISIFCFMVVEWLQRNKQHGLEIPQINAWFRRLIYIAIICSIVMFCGENEEFIYFQF